MSTAAERPDRTAFEQWSAYLADPSADSPPDASLLSALADALVLLQGKGRRACWGDLLVALKLVSGSDGPAIAALVKPGLSPADLTAASASPAVKTWALFLQVVCVLQPLDAANVEELNRLCTLFAQGKGRGDGPSFVKRCWDGYFVFCRQVGLRFLQDAPCDQPRANWPLAIPCIATPHWVTLSRNELEDTDGPVWAAVKQCTEGRVELRYARNEFQMVALWAGVKKTDRGPGRFKAVQRPSSAALSFRDMGLANAKTLSFDNTPVYPSFTVRTTSFGLRGLLWAMGFDGGLRRSKAFTDIQQTFAKHCRTLAIKPMTQPEDRYPLAREVELVVARRVVQRPDTGHRFAPAATDSAIDMSTTDMLDLDNKACTHEWLDDEQTYVMHIKDSPRRPLRYWKGGRFFDLAGGKTMPVLFGIEDAKGQIGEWVWGDCEDWGLDEDGTGCSFLVWPVVADEHAFRQQERTPFVKQAAMLDMVQLGDFEDGYCVLFVRLSWI